MTDVCHFECWKATCHAISEDNIISLQILICLPKLGRSQSTLGQFLRSLKKWSKTCITQTKPKIRSSTFLTSWQWTILIWQEATKCLGGSLELSQTRSMPFHRLFSIQKDTLPAKATKTNSQKSDLWTGLFCCWRPSNEILRDLLKVYARDYQMSFFRVK